MILRTFDLDKIYPLFFLVKNSGISSPKEIVCGATYIHKNPIVCKYKFDIV
jgi:hypothetical protein